MKANCPSCGAEVEFKSSVSVFSVCGHCRFMLVRHDMDLESLGRMAQLPDDVSPLKIGTRGKYKNTAFEIVGRLKVAWSEGYWNEWFLLFDGGSQGWLAEAMGLFMLSTEAEVTKRVPKLAEVRAAAEYQITPSQKFFVDDIKEAACIGSEGELPFKGLQGRKTTSVDLSNNSGEFANIEYSEDGAHLYIGRYVDFDNLELSNLRDLPADMKKIRSVELFKCPSCGGPFSMLTPGLTASVACRYCGSTIDVTNRNLAILSKADTQMKIRPLIPVGSKGKLFGTEWEVTGFMRRADQTGQYPWDEYLLFNPCRGIRWLTTYNGHWNYVETARFRPESAFLGVYMKLGDKSFKKFLIGKARVVYVIGEFYWRVRIGETVDVADYILPPEILSCESDGSEVNWSLGRYIEPEEVALAFGLKGQLPQKTGVAPNQPSPYAARSQRAWFSFAVFALLVSVLQLYFAFTAQDKEVYKGSFSFNQGEKARPFVSPSFDLPGETGNLSATLYSPVQNDWIETDVELVDEKTNKSTGFSQTAEYYSGTDGGESWSEGSRDSNFILDSVPGGRYHLVIQPNADATRKGEKTFILLLRRNVVTWSNFFVALILLSVYPLSVWCRGRKFELNRWSESDLSGGADNSDEDEGE
jgi:DNA-directed RNA polymerase subunit RPC12/RpoP